MKRYTSLLAAGLMLVALAPLQSKAANNTWNGGSGAEWDTATPNWAGPAAWNNGDDAIFGLGFGPLVNLGNTNNTAPVSSASLTFSSPGYNIYAASIGTNITLTGGANITNNGTGSQIAVSIAGTAGLTYRGTGDLTLRGSTLGSGPTLGGPGNTYTGETYVRSGTLILSVTNRTSAVNGNNLQNHGTEWAVSQVGGVDAGATLKIGNFYAGGQVNFLIARGQIQESTHLIMNGGTFDDNGSDNLQSYPAIKGTGYITNSSGVARCVLKMSPLDNVAQSVTNACIMSGELVVSPITNKFGGQIDVDVQGANGTTWYFAGANTHHGSWRITGGTVRFTQNGGMGTPNRFNTPNTVRFNGANPAATLDLFGTSQTTGGFTGNGNSTGNGGSPNARVVNDNPGTTSILTIGAADLGLNALPPSLELVVAHGTNILFTPGAGSVSAAAFLDNSGTGGNLGVTKIGTNIAQFSGTWNISGPLVVSNGFLNIVPGSGVGATPVLNGPVYLYNNGQSTAVTGTNSYLGLFTLGQNAVIPVPALYIDGVPQTNGLYGAYGNTGGAREVSVISNGGTPNGDVLQVHDFQPPMTVTNNGTSLGISWPYETYKLQAQTNSTSVGITTTWYDYPGGATSPVTVPIDQNNGTVFLKLNPKP